MQSIFIYPSLKLAFEIFGEVNSILVPKLVICNLNYKFPAAISTLKSCILALILSIQSQRSSLTNHFILNIYEFLPIYIIWSSNYFICFGRHET